MIRQSKGRASRIYYFSVLLLMCIGLGACQARQTNNESQDTSASILGQKEEELSLDPRLIPDFTQVLAEYQKSPTADHLTLDFESEGPFSYQGDNFNVTVNHLAYLTSASKDETDLLLLHLSIENTSSLAINFPPKRIKLQTLSQNYHAYSDANKYSSDSGYLADILNRQNNRIGPDMSLEGYLVFSVNDPATETVNFVFDDQATAKLNSKLHLLKLDLGPSDFMSGGMLLPLNQASKEFLEEQAQFIQDPSINNLLGNKVSLIDTQVENDLLIGEWGDIEVKRWQLMTLNPFQAYEVEFQSYSQRPIILSLEYVLDKFPEKMEMFLNYEESNLRINQREFPLVRSVLTNHSETDTKLSKQFSTSFILDRDDFLKADACDKVTLDLHLEGRMDFQRLDLGPLSALDHPLYVRQKLLYGLDTNFAIEDSIDPNRIGLVKTMVYEYVIDLKNKEIEVE